MCFFRLKSFKSYQYDIAVWYYFFYLDIPFLKLKVIFFLCFLFNFIVNCVLIKQSHFMFFIYFKFTILYKKKF